jgi:hypothetical protein
VGCSALCSQQVSPPTRLMIHPLEPFLSQGWVGGASHTRRSSLIQHQANRDSEAMRSRGNRPAQGAVSTRQAARTSHYSWILLSSLVRYMQGELPPSKARTLASTLQPSLAPPSLLPS